MLIYGIYTCACWVLLSDELPAEGDLAADAHAVTQAAQDGPFSSRSSPKPGPGAGMHPGIAAAAPAASHEETLIYRSLRSADPQQLLAPREAVFLAGLPALEAFGAVMHPLLLPRLPFLPLLLTSVYCAGGMAWAWWRMARHYLGEVPRTKTE